MQIHPALIATNLLLMVLTVCSYGMTSYAYETVENPAQQSILTSKLPKAKQKTDTAPHRGSGRRELANRANSCHGSKFLG